MWVLTEYSEMEKAEIVYAWIIEKSLIGLWSDPFFNGFSVDPASAAGLNFIFSCAESNNSIEL